MDCFAGLDVSIDETAICVVDEAGKVMMTASVPSDPQAIAAALAPYGKQLKRVGHEAGALSPWLHPGLIQLGIAAVCLETRHVRSALAAQRNKTDAADALGIAHIMRTGWFRAAHIKTEACYRMRLLLVQRRNLKRKFLDLENTIRHSLKAFGIKLGAIGRGKFDAAVRKAVESDALSARLMDCMLCARAALWTEYVKLHKLVLQIVARDELCRRFLVIPGVGPVTALTFATAIDDPHRFRRSRDVAAYFGLTSRRWQSGTSIDVKGRISKAGDPDVRRALYSAAHVMLTRYKRPDRLKEWGDRLMKTKCRAKASVAVARKLAVIMHAMWKDGTAYHGAPVDVSPRAGGKLYFHEAQRMDAAA
ncbi:IS110 family transposase [Novosphingobium sp. G106]|uniref:IS110 family transposase n=1 Tax=Novosphingobium sp. G106 TaxID=2849500 RepID=UPI0020C37700|nr:IS110 family transposase [Novosphingobium sp. G106]